MVRLKLRESALAYNSNPTNFNNAGSIPATSTNREMADMQFMACPTPTLTGNRSASWTHLSYNIHRAVEQWPARKAHNLEVVGSNPASATNFKTRINAKYELLSV